MLISLYELLAGSSFLRHLSLLLLVVAVAMPNLVSMRRMLLLAGVAGIVQAAVVSYDPIGLFWWSLVVLVLVAQLVLSSDRRFGRALNDEERLFHERAVPSLTRGQVRLLLDAGRWRDVAAGAALTRQGELINELSFISRGLVDIVVDGHKVAECGPGTLVGEVGLSTGEPATATAICATPVRFLGFDANRLYALLDRHVELQDAIELAIQRSIRDKLHRSNIVAAHSTG